MYLYMYAVTLQELSHNKTRRACNEHDASYIQCTYTTALRGERKGQEAQDLTLHRPIYFRFGS